MSHRAPRLTRWLRCATPAIGLLLAPAGLPAARADDGAAPAGACPDGPQPQINVVLDIAEPTLELGISLAELGRMTRKGQDASSHTLGLTRVTSGSSETFRHRLVTQPDGTHCLGFTDGAIVLRMVTNIYVVSELAPGSCLYEQVLDHEQRHAKVARRLFTEFAATVETALQRTLSQTPYVAIEDPAAANQIAAARLREIVEPLERDFKSTYRKRQAIIDTSGEYVRVREACPGEQEKLLEAVGG